MKVIQETLEIKTLNKIAVFLLKIDCVLIKE